MNQKIKYSFAYKNINKIIFLRQRKALTGSAEEQTKEGFDRRKTK